MMKQIRYFFTLLLLAVASVGWADSYVKVTQTSDITNGTYLIVYEDGNVAFNGALEKLDDVSNTIDVTISDGVIQSTEAVDAASFTINVADGTLQSASGFYVGVTSYANGLKQSDKADAFINKFAIDDVGNALITVETADGTLTVTVIEVAPYVGAWIETSKDELKDPIKIVAPYVGAWIETVYIQEFLLN